MHITRLAVWWFDAGAIVPPRTGAVCPRTAIL
jgi:hypothetical protein